MYAHIHRYTCVPMNLSLGQPFRQELDGRKPSLDDPILRELREAIPTERLHLAVSDMYIYTYIRIHMHIYIYTYVYIYTHVQFYVFALP